MKTSAKSNPIKLVIVEDVKEVRDGLRYLLNLDGMLQVVGTYARAETLLDALPVTSKPDIVLMDIGLPAMDGIEATRRIKSRYPDISILILTIFEEIEAILDAIKAGADGYLLKNTRPGQLVEQIKNVRAGGSAISPTVARRLLQEIQKEGKQGPKQDYCLTPREKEILKSIADGDTYKEIAQKHFIAGSTAKKHILHIYRKLNVSSKAEFVRKVIDEDLI
jgi:DNA-binding NarL/FixJ family response regulator